MTVRTRIAPSPTGSPHVGTGYIALFNYCFAKKSGGQFILRIDDTDQTRSTRESEQQIFESLRWLGLDWDEGPDKNGDFGPYRQSERTQIYQDHIKMLLENKSVFHCFCTPQRLDALRKEQMANKQTTGYDGHCLTLSEVEVQQKLDAGESYVIRLKIPSDGSCVFHDKLCGSTTIAWSQIDAQVLMKSDGYPTYHFATVVDDHLMGITHVLRGEEWINSTPKHILIYDAFGWPKPEYCHLPLLRNPDKSKLSKRHNPTSMLYYQRLGILAQGLLNYLGRMGWSMPDEREKFSLDEMIEHFDLDRVSPGGPIFDLEKLYWLNGQWLRELNEEQFAARVVDWALNQKYMEKIIPLAQTRVEKLSDLGPLCTHFFQGLLDLSEQALTFPKSTPEQVGKMLTWSVFGLDEIKDWQADAIETVIKQTASLLDVKLKVLLPILFVAVTGKKVSTPLFATMDVIGRDLSRARIMQAIDVVGGSGKKQQKRWRSEYEKTLNALD